MKPNIKKAKKCLESSIFSEYSEAYVISNENLRDAIKIIPEKAKILTVAASGDHPMFCSLKNPEFIDSFDISYNAKIIMDIKTVALHELNHSEYLDFLGDLYCAADIFEINNMYKIMPKLSKTEQNYLNAMRQEQIFCQGSHPFYYTYLFPTHMEYTQMQQVIHKPFNFIWSNIADLHMHLKQKYDFIHLSNIFDYTRRDQIEPILLSLMKHSDIGCKIYFESYIYYMHFNKDILQAYCDTNSQKLNQKWEFKEEPCIDRVKCIMHRVR